MNTSLLELKDGAEIVSTTGVKFVAERKVFFDTAEKIVINEVKIRNLLIVKIANS